MKNSTSRKKWLLTLSLTIAFFNATIAQNTNWLVGGNTLTGTPTVKKIGSLNCYEVQVIANNIVMQTYTPACKGSNGSSITFSAANVDFGGVQNLKLGSGTIKTDTTSTSNASFLIESLSSSSKPVLYASSLFKGKTNSYGLKANAVGSDGYGYGVFTEGGRYGTCSYALGGSYSGSCYGIYGNSAGTAGTRIGIRGIASTSGFAQNYGVYASASGGAGNNAGYFSGNVTYTGSLSKASDLRLKENIKPFNGALAKINKIEVKTYNFKAEYGFMNLPKENQIGLIAQNLEKVFPELVTEIVHPADFDPRTNEKISDEVRFKGVDYLGLIPVLIEAVKEQQVEIENLNTIKNENAEMKNELSALKNEIAEMKSMMMQMQSQKVSSIQNQKAALEQNAPNPFSEKTTINYFLPLNVQNAMINIYSIENRLIKTYHLSDKGENQLIITSGTLSVGSYIYELVIDNKVVDSKKMVLTK